MRLDIGWLDLLSAFVDTLLPRNWLKAQKQAADSWSTRDEILIALSVRSAFDLMLRALQLPRGSEVLMSALTVPDMHRIVVLHGLVPVPIDVDQRGKIDVASLRKAISPVSRIVVVAHLFGEVTPLDEVIAIGKESGLIVIEDCAQSFQSVGENGHPHSDAALFSFGPIKTCTALGGSVARVKSPELRQRMNELLTHDPIQARWSLMMKVARFSLLKLLSGKRSSAIAKRAIELLGGDFDSLANSVVRGFPPQNLLVNLRRRPSSALLRLLRRRWRGFDAKRVETRTRLGRHLDDRLTCIGLCERSPQHSYWVYPLFVPEPAKLRDRLRAAGFDATCQARMSVVPATAASSPPNHAMQIWRQVIFIPWYPELTIDAVDEMADIIGTVLTGNA